MKMYTAKQVCEMLVITRRTLYNYVKTGKLKAVKVGGFLRFTEDEIQDFLQRNETGVSTLVRQDESEA